MTLETLYTSYEQARTAYLNHLHSLLSEMASYDTALYDEHAMMDVNEIASHLDREFYDIKAVNAPVRDVILAAKLYTIARDSGISAAEEFKSSN